MDEDYGYDYFDYGDESEDGDDYYAMKEAEMLILKKDRYLKARASLREKLCDYKIPGDYNSFSDIKQKANTINEKDLGIFLKTLKRLVNNLNYKKKRLSADYCYGVLNTLLIEVKNSDHNSNKFVKAYLLSRLLTSCNCRRLKVPTHFKHLYSLIEALYDNFIIADENYLFHYLIGIKKLNFYIPDCNSHSFTMQSTLINSAGKSQTLYTTHFKNKGSGTIIEKVDAEIVSLSEKIYELDIIERIFPKDLEHKLKYFEYSHYTFNEKCYHCIRKRLIRRRRFLQLALNRLIENPQLEHIVNNASYFSCLSMFTRETRFTIFGDNKTPKRLFHWKIWSDFPILTQEQYQSRILKYKGKTDSIGCHRPVRERIFRNSYNSFHPNWKQTILKLEKYRALSKILMLPVSFIPGTIIPRRRHLDTLEAIYRHFTTTQQYLKTQLLHFVKSTREAKERKAMAEMERHNRFYMGFEDKRSDLLSNLEKIRQDWHNVYERLSGKKTLNIARYTEQHYHTVISECLKVLCRQDSFFMRHYKKTKQDLSSGLLTISLEGGVLYQFSKNSKNMAQSVNFVHNYGDDIIEHLIVDLLRLNWHMKQKKEKEIKWFRLIHPLVLVDCIDDAFNTNNKANLSQEVKEIRDELTQDTILRVQLARLKNSISNVKTFYFQNDKKIKKLVQVLERSRDSVM